MKGFLCLPTGFRRLGRPLSGSLRVTSFSLALVAASSAYALDYKTDIIPIMKKHCWECHSNEKKVKGNLALDDYAEMEEFQITKFSLIRPGDPEESQFLRLMKLPEGDSDCMPPKGDRVPEEEIALIEKWILQGAPMDAEGAKMADAEADKRKQEYLSWTNTEGKAIEARFVRLEGDKVVLLMRNGKSYPYPLANLSAESQALAKEMGGE